MNIFKRLYCKLFGHGRKITKCNSTGAVQQIVCHRCGALFRFSTASWIKR